MASYVAPEVLLTQQSDTAADLWSLGCVAYELLIGKPPFKSGNEQATFEKILWGEIEFPQVLPSSHPLGHSPARPRPLPSSHLPRKRTPSRLRARGV